MVFKVGTYTGIIKIFEKILKEQINITRPFYDEISKYSRSILANISSTKQ
jgi:hypothetical protein